MLNFCPGNILKNIYEINLKLDARKKFHGEVSRLKTHQLHRYLIHNFRVIALLFLILILSEAKRTSMKLGRSAVQKSLNSFRITLECFCLLSSCNLWYLLFTWGILKNYFVDGWISFDTFIFSNFSIDNVKGFLSLHVIKLHKKALSW
jgi:hypothetical protein